jgi:hypothetical protein
VTINLVLKNFFLIKLHSSFIIQVIVGGMRVPQPKVHHEADVNNNKNKDANATSDEVVDETDKL